jgi:NDP-sugar pyrophosphorylase family protein
MKAMILAAGIGTRLRPLTNDRPKALVEVAGHPMLEIALRRLLAAGVHEVIINTYHFADMVSDYLEMNRNFGMRIEVSREDELLDSGGGLKKAAWFFLEDGAHSQKPFILHNVDVVSNIDLARMLRFHLEQDALATLAVQDRFTSRPLLFDTTGQFCGRPVGTMRAAGDGNSATGWTAAGFEAGSGMQELAFTGIHVISPRIFEEIEEEGAFSIITAYARLAARGERIKGFRADEYYWRDLGRPESVALAERELARGTYSTG